MKKHKCPWADRTGSAELPLAGQLTECAGSSLSQLPQKLPGRMQAVYAVSVRSDITHGEVVSPVKSWL